MRAPPVAGRRPARSQLGAAIMPPEVYRAELVCLTETEEGGLEESGTFTSDFAREMAAGGGLSDTDPVFKSDFASLVHSSYREELVRQHLFLFGNVRQPNFDFQDDEEQTDESEVLYQNMDEARRETIQLSSISKVETVVAVNHQQQQSREEEELAQLSITSADYNKLSEEVERLQKQLAGMDDSRRVYEAATKQLVSFLELVSSQLSVETMLENKQRLRERTKQVEFERSNRARMMGSRLSDVGLGDLGMSDLSIGGSAEEIGRRKKEGEKGEGKRRVTVTSGDSSSFRRQRGLRRRPVSVQGSPLLYLGKGNNSDGSSDNNDTVDSIEQNNDSGKDSGRFTDSERGSPTGGGSRRRQLGARGAELVRQVRRFLGKSLPESSSTKSPVKGLSDRFVTTPPDIPVRTLTERPSPTSTPIGDVKREAISPPSNGKGKENRNRVVIQLGSELPGWRGAVRQQERRKSFTSVPRRSRGSIETDSCGKVTVPVPFIQPPAPWL